MPGFRYRFPDLVDDRTSEIVPMSGVESWEQLGLDSWRFHIRPGVKFHNGALLTVQRVHTGQL
ncbi:MAG: hypothetical protein CM1200mP35_10370 [Chloroflexota bacterium]|nr:MAG: hypothetical protein CM1200mP35_10370 [Chloroflexota bacterium]